MLDLALQFQEGKKSLIVQLILLLVILSSVSLFSQSNLTTKNPDTNLEIFYKLADSSAYDDIQSLPANQNNIQLNLTLGTAYNIFSNEIINCFHSKGKNIISEPLKDSAVNKINFVLDNAKVRYGALFQKKIFGDFYTTRYFVLSGNYLVFSPQMKTNNFSFSFSDTVMASDVKNLENISYPFTQAQLPAEPFLSSVYEPVIAVGVAALTVILFFTVRSK